MHYESTILFKMRLGNIYYESIRTGTLSNSATQDLTSQAGWSSSNTSVAAIGDALGTKGRVTSKATGTSTITAEALGHLGTTDLTTTVPLAGRISGDTSAVHEQPVVAFNNAGHGLALWRVYNGNYYTVLHSHYDPGASSWSAEQALAPNQYVYSFDVATNGTTFMVVWYQNGSIYANTFDGAVWGAAQTIESSGNSTDQPKVASNGTGYGVAWRQYDGTAWSIYANIYSGGTWTTEQAIESGSGHAFEPQIASDGSGYGVTWYQYDGSVYSIYANIYNGSWGADQPLESGSGSAYPPQIASNGTGYAVTWRQYDSTAYVYNIYANIYSGGTWTTEQAIESGSAYAYEPRIASNGTSYAVTWYQYDYATYSDTIFANIYSSGTWTTEQRIASGSGYAYSPQIASNGTGYGATWTQYDGTAYSIYANVFDGSSWATAQTIESGSGSADSPRIARKGAGYGAVWRQDNGDVAGIYANLYNGSWQANATDIVAGFYKADSFAPRIVTNDAGVSLAVWQQYNKGIRRVYGSIRQDGVWGSPFALANDYAYDPDVATNGTTFMVVWWQYGNIYAKIYDGAAWGAVQVIGYGYVPKVASNGTSYAVTWSGWDGTAQGIFANVFDGSSWGTAQTIESGSGDASSPVIASNGTGYAVAWYQYDGSVWSIYANVYNGAWGTEQAIESGSGHAYEPQIASNGTSYAVAWYQYDGATNSIYANVYNGAWGAEQTIESSADYADNPRIASNGTGYAVTWNQNGSIYANIYSSGTWTTEQTIETGTDYAYGPSITRHGAGYVAAWLQWDSSYYSVYGNRFDGAAWGSNVALLESGAGDASEVFVSATGDRYGVVWVQNDPADAGNETVRKVRSLVGE